MERGRKGNVCLTVLRALNRKHLQTGLVWPPSVPVYLGGRKGIDCSPSGTDNQLNLHLTGSRSAVPCFQAISVIQYMDSKHEREHCSTLSSGHLSNEVREQPIAG